MAVSLNAKCLCLYLKLLLLSHILPILTSWLIYIYVSCMLVYGYIAIKVWEIDYMELKLIRYRGDKFSTNYLDIYIQVR